MQTQSDSRIRSSPSVWMSLILVVVYAAFAMAGGSATAMNYEVALPFVQVNEQIWRGMIYMLFTSMFLHADFTHLFGNVIFLLIFGTSLEEQVTRRKWLITYFSSGVTGNIAFLFLGGDAIGLGASGAIWGLLGAAGGLRGLIGMIFYIGVNIFAGGGFLAHAGGLMTGLAFRYLWFGRRLGETHRTKSPHISDAGKL